MKDIRLKQLRGKNFKGLKDHALTLDGKNANVYGKNASGKTTLYDMFLWLFFDKDSSGRTKFGIKPTDASGEEIHGLEHEVEAILDINSQELKLKKMMVEKWSKPHGKPDKVFSGHVTSYWVDDVPVKEKDYIATINSIVSEELFRLLTNPHHFNNDKAYPWEKRRKILMEICGDLTDEEVISSDKRLHRLTEILNGKSVDNYRLIVKEQVKKLKEEKEKIPVRIDEANLSLTEDTTDYTAVETEIQQRSQEIADIETEQTSVANAATIYRQKQQKLRGLENDLKARKEAIDSTHGAVEKKLFDERSKLESQKYSLQSGQSGIKSKISLAEGDINSINENLANLRTKWAEENAKTYVEPGESFTCPTCGQALPDETVEQKLSEMRSNFEKAKKAELDRITAEGKAGSEKITLFNKSISEWNDRLKNIDADLIIIDERMSEISAELSQDKPAADYESDHEYKSILLQIQALEAELDQPIEDNSQELIQKKLGLREIVDSLQKILNNKNNAEKTRARINGLMQEERRLAGQISELEGQEFLMDEFTRAKVNLLEGPLNRRFKTVQFKLFDTFDSREGLKECCRTMVNTNGAWTEWLDANNAGRINAGVDIINTLSGHYGIFAPIFIDNRESVTDLIETRSQVINLIVSEPDKKLRVEVAE